LRDRLHDLDDLANRVLHQLTGQPLVARNADLPDNAVLVARMMGPAALLEYDRKKLRGLVLEEGGPSSHVAVVARALGIPAIGEVENITTLVEDNDAIIIDGGSGEAHLRPAPDLQAAYAEKARLRARRQEQYRALRNQAAVTRDGVRVRLAMNAGLVIDLPHVEESGAEGIGLFRTELQFMMTPQFPRVSEQIALYSAVFASVGDKPVTFRTLDIGGDKVLPYMRTFEEENPALGWRAIRIGLDRPGLLRSQLRAMLRASGGRDISIMFPMVTTAAEFDAAKALVGRELRHMERHGYAKPRNLDLGIMIEVPSILWQLDEILQRVDFVSVGSNDLVQYLTASDRDNKRVSARFDPLSAPVLRALKLITDKARQTRTPVSLCGEIGGRPLEALALIALGYRDLSMTASSIGPVKAMILALDAGEAAAFLLPRIEATDGKASLRAELRAFAESKGLPL
jgi:phosphotransferase system enzyme I (PtsP)